MGTKIYPRAEANLMGSSHKFQRLPRLWDVKPTVGALYWTYKDAKVVQSAEKYMNVEIWIFVNKVSEHKKKVISR